MAKPKKQEVATQTNAFTEEKPDWLDTESTRGQENVTTDDLVIPRLGVIQDLSPQRKKTKPEYIDGAESGMLFNNVTSALYGESLVFVPCYYIKEWCIWKSQDAGGGFEGAWPTEAEAIEAFQEKGFEDQVTEKDGPMYEIVDMAQHYGMIIHDDKDPEDIVISMSKSKMKVNRQFNTLVKMAGGDRFSRAYRISAVEDTNKNDQDYYNFSVSPLGFVSEEIFHLGEKMYESVSAGEKKVDRKDS